MLSIYETLRLEPSLSSLLRVVERSGMQELLNEYGPNTLFAPTDLAFERLSIEYRDKVLNDDAFVRAMVDNHIVAGAFTADELHAFPALRSNARENIPVRDVGGLRIGGCTIVRTIACANGVINVIDGVLVPFEREQRLSA